ncbi:MAG TPA: type II secretion system protein GspG [Rhodobacteraceae bacterium]|nr:type II secretion system protein GspG [Paracoccaceae bacterium]
MITNSRNIRRRTAGITILEILVVLSIIAMIAAVAGPRLISYLGRAKSETAALQIKQLGSAVQLFYIDMGRYPTDSEGLAVLMQAPAGETAWKGPYMQTSEALKDPWGRDYQYTAPTEGGEFGIVSFGRDGVQGGSGEDADLSL